MREPSQSECVQDASASQRLAFETSSPLMRCLAFLLGIACLSALGCGVRSANKHYRILDHSDKSMLAPPGIRNLAGNSKTFALRPGTRSPDCMSDRGGIKIVTRRDKVKVSMQQDTLEAMPAGWLSRWADTLIDGGCLPGVERGLLVKRILEACPLDIRDTYRTAFGQPSTSDFIDFRPGQKLKIVGPVLRDNAEPLNLTVDSTDSDGAGGLSLAVRSSSNLLGYEESRYLIVAEGGGDLRLERDYTKFIQDGEITMVERPSVTAATFIPNGSYIRMIYLARVAKTSDHDVLFVSGPTRDELEARSLIVFNDPGKCLEPGSAEWCQEVSNKLSLNLYVTVALNGTDTDIAPGVPLGQVLRNGIGRRMNIAPRGLAVYRPHGNRLAKVDFDPSSGTIMRLPLLGGESVVLPDRQQE